MNLSGASPSNLAVIPWRTAAPRALLAVAVCGLAGADAPTAAGGRVDFSRDVRPILSNNCFQCHGPDEKVRKAGLRLDTEAGALADLGGHAALVPGKPDESEIVRRVSGTGPGRLMPPRKSGKKLTPHEVDLLTRWVKQGARYAGHWAYVRPVRPAEPPVKDAAWPKNPVDRFLLARMEREGLKPSPEADRYALIRRVSLDLTGLPPTVQEADAFAKDPDPLAYEKLVDRLLQRPTYGEHWAQMWLDLARYGDSAGYADDPLRTIWLYRDYVIKSFNANKPFDQFTVEQIAGDLLPNPTEDQLIATAFHRNTLTNNEGGTNDEEFRNVAVVDRVNTTMAVWMGTTMACAQCHSHKFDPISQEEYFRFFAFFNNTEDADRTDESPILPVFSPEEKRQRSRWAEELARLEASMRTPTAETRAGQLRWEKSFPRELRWQAPKPGAVKSRAGSAVRVEDGGAVHVAAGAKDDVYTVELPVGGTPLRALRLEALPDPKLPGMGPGHAAGNFVVTRVAATLTPPGGRQPAGRFVRVEVPGKQKILSLAEVQIFRGNDNVAPKGEARQSSTAFEGDAKRAVDGNTDGRFTEARSTTHTAVSDDPWWEVDLKAEQPLDRIVVWNRTDPGTEDRLGNFRLTVLDARRQTVWQQTVSAPPKPSASFAIGPSLPVAFGAAVADFAQAGFGPENVLNNKNPKQNGWAVGGSTGSPHALTLLTPDPVPVPAGSKLIVMIEQTSQQANHTLGHFRLSVTDDARASEWGQTPRPVREALTTPPGNRTPAQKEVLEKHYLTLAPELAGARKRSTELARQLADSKPVTVPVMRELKGNQRRKTRIQLRGNYLVLDREVTEGTPAAFQPLPPGAPRNRLTLARWLVDEKNPLTARVIANRYWEQIFGTGIVASSEDFGAQGDGPFHPELLDWLATELVRLKWDTKAFLRLLVTSAAYRQSSRVTPALEQRDPDNRLLARGPRVRLSAETVRDQALAVAGLLSPKMYGPPVKPPQPSLGLSAAFGSGIDWQPSAGEDRHRRALYTLWRRSNPYPSMAAFDAPNREVCTVRRGRTNTPLQALVTLNDPVYVEAAQALARRVVADGGTGAADRARHAFRLCLTRPPEPGELDRIERLHQQALAKLRPHPDQALRLAADPLGPPPKGADVTELAAWTVVGNVLLNLDETLMKR